MDILRKFAKFNEIVKHNGGALKSIKRLLREDDLKIGTLVGTDRYGNKYYENNSYFMGRNRWVVYNELVGQNYDPSQIPAEWFGWIHYKTDLLPDQVSDKIVFENLRDFKRQIECLQIAFEQLQG